MQKRRLLTPGHVIESCRECYFHKDTNVHEFCEHPDLVAKDYRPVIYYKNGSNFAPFCPLEETD